MTDNNPRRDDINPRDAENDALDRELDEALAKFATVEPRVGLEERILASLRSQRARATERFWWRWPAAVALAAAIVVTLFISRGSTRPLHKIASQRPPASTQINEHAGARVENNGGSGLIRLHDAGSERLVKPRVIGYRATVVASEPKLDHFPSPQPLSEQERMLTEYVAAHHQQAVLIARARMAELKSDWVEEAQEALEVSNRPASDPSVNQQENR